VPGVYTCKVISSPLSPSRPSALKKILKEICSSNKQREFIKKLDRDDDELDKLQGDKEEAKVKQKVERGDDGDNGDIDDNDNFNDGDNGDDGENEGDRHSVNDGNNEDDGANSNNGDDEDDGANSNNGDNGKDGGFGDEDILRKLRSSLMSELQNQAIRVCRVVCVLNARVIAAQ